MEHINSMVEELFDISSSIQDQQYRNLMDHLTAIKERLASQVTGERPARSINRDDDDDLITRDGDVIIIEESLTIAPQIHIVRSLDQYLASAKIYRAYQDRMALQCKVRFNEVGRIDDQLGIALTLYCPRGNEIGWHLYRNGSRHSDGGWPAVKEYCEGTIDHFCGIGRKLFWYRNGQPTPGPGGRLGLYMGMAERDSHIVVHLYEKYADGTHVTELRHTGPEEDEYEACELLVKSYAKGISGEGYCDCDDDCDCKREGSLEQLAQDYLFVMDREHIDAPSNPIRRALSHYEIDDYLTIEDDGRTVSAGPRLEL